MPNAMHDVRSITSSTQNDMNDQSNGRKRAADNLKDRRRRSPKQGPDSPSTLSTQPKSLMTSMSVSLGLESSGRLLRRTNSVERKLGLLFTDAAHTVLE
jgi:hypothetical protein